MKGFVAGIFCTIIILAVAIYIVICTGCIDPAADQPIPDLERWIAMTSLRAYLARETPKVTNPIEKNPETLANGAALYLNNCAVCHGYADGKRPPIGAFLNKRAPAFGKDDWSQYTDGWFYWFVAHGVRLTGMPAYKQILSDKEMWEIILFIKNRDSLPAPVDHYWRSAKAPVATPPTINANEIDAN